MSVALYTSEVDVPCAVCIDLFDNISGTWCTSIGLGLGFGGYVCGGSVVGGTYGYEET